METQSRRKHRLCQQDLLTSAVPLINLPPKYCSSETVPQTHCPSFVQSCSSLASATPFPCISHAGKDFSYHRLTAPSLFKAAHPLPLPRPSLVWLLPGKDCPCHRLTIFVLSNEIHLLPMLRLPASPFHGYPPDGKINLDSVGLLNLHPIAFCCRCHWLLPLSFTVILLTRGALALHSLSFLRRTDFLSSPEH